MSFGNKRIPHYALPNTTHVLPQYTNAEQDIIRESFSIGSFRSINHLPTELKPNYVNEAKNQHVDANITSAIVHAPHGSYNRVGGTRLFSEFEYIPSPYNLVDELKSKENKDHQEKMGNISKRDFVYASAFPPPVPSLQADRIVDPYEDVADQALRAKWLEKSNILHGPFAPATKDRSASSVHRGKLPDILMALRRELDLDWADTKFDIYSDEEDLVVLEFDLSSLDNPTGLLAYMNMLINTREVVSENGLSKIAELWNHTPGDGCVYYAFKPPWVRRPVTEAYFTLRPEKRSYRATLEHEKRMLDLETQQRTILASQPKDQAKAEEEAFFAKKEQEMVGIFDRGANKPLVLDS